MDRKSLLLEERESRTLDDKEKVEKILTQGGALQNMLDTFGWKILYDGFIAPHIEESRFLGADRKDLEDVRAEIRILKALLQFIEIRVKEANKVAEKIKK